MAPEGFRDGQALEGRGRIAAAATPAEPRRAGRLGGEPQEIGAIAHQHRVGLVGPVPFEHGEFGVVQGTALAVAEHPGEAEQARFARRQQLLAGEFRRGVQVERAPPAIRPDHLRGEGREMGLVAGGDLQGRGLDLDEAQAREMRPHRLDDPVAQDQPRPAVGMDVRRPPGRGIGRHRGTDAANRCDAAWLRENIGPVAPRDPATGNRAADGIVAGQDVDPAGDRDGEAA
ncbi:hypothetical protein AEGHOMDF_6182 [Methylobacterium soli]|nr:hypothetical protein AEGHOMDF_6182 [Methylobacterium soli]